MTRRTGPTNYFYRLMPDPSNIRDIANWLFQSIDRGDIGAIRQAVDWLSQWITDNQKDDSSTTTGEATP